MPRLTVLLGLAVSLLTVGILVPLPELLPSPEDSIRVPLPEERPRKGPDAERWYFSRWYEPQTSELDPEYLDSMHDQLAVMPREPEVGRAINSWQLKGPLTMQKTSGVRYTGRVLDIEDPEGSAIRFAAASGGLWSYEFIFPVPLSDEVTSLAVSTVSTNPTDADHIVVGTGEHQLRTGTGIWHTFDGGDNWDRSDVNVDSGTYGRVRFDPGNANIVHAVGSLGYYRSVDGGVTFVRRRTGYFTDLAINPSNSNILYAARWGFGIYKSTDNGFNWTLMSSGLPTSGIGRVAVCLSDATPGIVMCAMSKDDPADLLGVYRSTDHGVTWANKTPTTDYMNGQGWYDNVISMSPTNNNIVLVGGVSLWRSGNGGNGWIQVVDPDLHADYHAIAWDPDGDTVRVGNDGGWMVSGDKGLSWSSTGNVAPITQYYHVDVGRNDPSVMAGGSQDNGLSVTTNHGSTWLHARGGDGSGIAIDPGTPSRIWATNGVYSGNWAFQRERTTNSGLNWTQHNAGVNPSGQWFTKIRHDGVLPVWLYTSSGDELYRSTDLGSNWILETPSGFGADITSLTLSNWTSSLGSTIYVALEPGSSTHRLRVYYNGTWTERGYALPATTVRKVAVMRNSNEIAYALMNGTSSLPKVLRTTNHGVSWTDITGNLPNEIPVSDLVMHPSDPLNTLYLGTSFGCFRTTDGGGLWRRWNNGMPDATIVTEMTGVDSLSTSGRFHVVAGTYGRGIWWRDVSGDDPTGVAAAPAAGQGFHLESVGPNPFRERAEIRFSLSRPEPVDVSLFDVSGRLVERLADETLPAGRHQVKLDGQGKSAGVYFVKVTAGAETVTRKVVLVE